MNDCNLCSHAAAGASLRGGTVQLGVAAAIGDHAWARTEREAAVCPTRVCETAAAKFTRPEMWMFRDFLLAPVWHPWVREVIAWLCDHSRTSEWTSEDIEAEAVRQLRIAAINKWVVAHDQRVEVAVLAAEQERQQRVQVRALRSTLRRARR